MKIIKFSQCTPWCPYSSRYGISPMTGYYGELHAPDSRPACLMTDNLETSGHFRLVKDVVCFKEFCFLKIFKGIK